MAEEFQADVTTLLDAIHAGDSAAQDRLVERIYHELERMAARLMARERPDHTLEPAALVNEALMRLLNQSFLARTTNRRYLFAASARAMRHILIEHHRRRQAAVHGGGWQRTSLDSILEYFVHKDLDIQALHEALEGLKELHARQYEVVEMLTFGGFTQQEVADCLELSPKTVERDWKMARAWLYRQLEDSSP